MEFSRFPKIIISKILTRFIKNKFKIDFDPGITISKLEITDGPDNAAIINISACIETSKEDILKLIGGMNNEKG